MNYQYPNNSPQELTTEELLAELLRRKVQKAGSTSSAISPLPNQPFSAAPISHGREVEVIDLDSNRGQIRKLTWGQSR